MRPRERRTLTDDDDERLDVLLSSSLLLPSNLQFRCMKYLVFLAILNIFISVGCS